MREGKNRNLHFFPPLFSFSFYCTRKYLCKRQLKKTKQNETIIRDLSCEGTSFFSKQTYFIMLHTTSWQLAWRESPSQVQGKLKASVLNVLAIKKIFQYLGWWKLWPLNLFLNGELTNSSCCFAFQKMRIYLFVTLNNKEIEKLLKHGWMLLEFSQFF